VEYEYYHLWDNRDTITNFSNSFNNRITIFAAEEWEISPSWNTDINFDVFKHDLDIVFGSYETEFYKNRKNIPHNATIQCWGTYWCTHTNYQLKKENTKIEKTDIDIPFISLNNQPHQHRCQLLDNLSKEGLLKKSAVTWHYPDVEYDWKHWSPKHLFLKDNFVNSRNSYKKLPSQFSRSFVNIVAESTADVPFVTEKTWVPIFLGKPFLVLGAAGIHQYLESLGIDLYTEVFDYSFDNYPNIEDRIQGIVENLKRVKKQNLNQLTETLSKKLDYNKYIATKISKDDSLIPDIVKNHYEYMKNNREKIRGIDHLWNSLKEI
jgi:hypothetical protein